MQRYSCSSSTGLQVNSEKIAFKIRLTVVEQFSVFFCISINAITSFNISYAVPSNKGLPHLHESVDIIHVSHRFRILRVCGTRFVTAVSNEQNRIGVSYFPRQLRGGHGS